MEEIKYYLHTWETVKIYNNYHKNYFTCFLETSCPKVDVWHCLWFWNDRSLGFNVFLSSKFTWHITNYKPQYLFIWNPINFTFPFWSDDPSKSFASDGLVIKNEWLRCLNFFSLFNIDYWHHKHNKRQLTLLEWSAVKIGKLTFDRFRKFYITQLFNIHYLTLTQLFDIHCLTLTQLFNNRTLSWPSSLHVIFSIIICLNYCYINCLSLSEHY